MAKAKLTCPTCKKEAAPRPANAAAPFCSERCRLIDLGRWLGEEYRVTLDEVPPRSDDDQDQS
jgi:endogenous inhibitor of DNA gyrase (YacG/DUF329 family)